jgi:hypothetical protein
MRVKGKDENPQTSGLSRKRVFLTVAIIVMILAAALFLLYSYSSRPGPPKAAIIDELSSSALYEASRYPNETFINNTKRMLLERFSTVDYFRDNATVDQYKHLPSQGYRLVVWRAHSALGNTSKYIAITTSETYGSGKYDQYFDDDQLTLTVITGDPKRYVSITPKFVQEVMEGRFEDTVIIFMSCNGLKTGYSATAEAFKAKGVKVFISWNGWIDPSDNDNSIAQLLDYLINKNDTVGDAVGKIQTFTYIYGPSSLHYYPENSEAAGYQVPNYKLDVTANISGFSAIPVLKRKPRGHD